MSECVVIGVPDDHWGERVHALVIPRADAEPDAEAIRAFCRERLAAYKVPKAIEVRADFPRLATGKIAKQALREAFWTGQKKRIHGT